jgi:hypothetical protein
MIRRTTASEPELRAAVFAGGLQAVEAYEILRQENQELHRFLKDGAAYLRHARSYGVSKDIVMTTLMHDFKGLANKEPCFLPRVSGYHQQPCLDKSPS